jgi:hypothetical protein
MLRPVGSSILLAILFSASSLLAAVTATFTFESPNFTVGESTPLSNEAPNSFSGPLGAALRASFSGSTDPGDFEITGAFNPTPGSGQDLFAPADPTAVLTVTLNEPVITLSLDFGMNATPPPGTTGSFLRLITPVGSLDQPATGGTLFASGHLSFSSATPFTTFQVEAFSGVTNAQTQFAIDNLAFTVVPEPSTIGLVALGLGTLRAAFARRRKTLN